MARRGRPPYSPTDAIRRKVAIAAGGGMAHEEIALALGISRTTLLKHFQRELSVGASERRLEVLNALHRSAKAGKVAAIKEYLAHLPGVAAPPEKPEREDPKGKKEQAKEAAKEALHNPEWAGLLGTTLPQ